MQVPFTHPIRSQSALLEQESPHCPPPELELVPPDDQLLTLQDLVLFGLVPHLPPSTMLPLLSLQTYFIVFIDFCAGVRVQESFAVQYLSLRDEQYFVSVT